MSNKDIAAQIVEARIVGDIVLTAAYAHELPRFGMPVGLTNYAAAYATGLLVARRLLAKLALADKYVGNTDKLGEDYNVEEISDGPRPFYALLDVGLHRTTTGSKIFAALKGAADGGLEVPHSDRRFVGYDKEEKKLNADVLKKHILGGHVADYMKHLATEDAALYEKQFAEYVKKGIKAGDLEGLWIKVHKAIRADPSLKKKESKGEKGKRYNKAKFSLAQRKDRIRQKLAAKAKKQESAPAAAVEEDEE